MSQKLVKTAAMVATLVLGAAASVPTAALATTQPLQRRMTTPEEATDYALQRLRLDRVSSVDIESVEVFPEGVAEVHGTLTMKPDRTEDEGRTVPFVLMFGGGAEVAGHPQSSPLNHDPKLISKRNVLFPESARERGASGVVQLQALVRRDGSTLVLQAMRSVPHGCTDAAIDAAEEWRWAPRIVLGREVDAIGILSLECSP